MKAYLEVLGEPADEIDALMVDGSHSSFGVLAKGRDASPIGILWTRMLIDHR